MNKVAILMFGLPCSGKTTWINHQKLVNYTVVSADKLKENHPDYNKDDTEPLHQWSVNEAEKELKELVKTQNNIVFDSGGINTNYTKRIIQYLRDNKYFIKLVYIKTPYEVCLERNRNRHRKVPEHAITDKAVIENARFNIISRLVDDVIIEDYFTNEHIFFDMDGVLAAQTTLPIINGEIDFVNAEIHKWQEPVSEVIARVRWLKHQGKRTYVLSASVNSIATQEKLEWLDTYCRTLFLKDNIYFVNQGKHKAEMLENICRKLKLEKRTVLLVDDTHSTLYDVKNRGMNAMHLSEFLVSF